MQIIYFTMFMTTLIVYVILGIPPAEQQFKTERDIVAIHMTAWHKAAVRRCATEKNCSGVVDPKPYMFASMLAGDAFSIARFSTRYDVTSNLLVTNVTAVAPSKGLSYNVIMGGLNKEVDGESSMIGLFDKSSSRVNFTALTGIYKSKWVDLPSALASPLTDGVPVIVTNL